MRGGAGGGGGGAARGGADPHGVASPSSGRPFGSANRKPPSWREFFLLLRPYFWPRGVPHRLAAAACFIALGLSKVANLLAPIYLGAATDQLVAGQFPAGAIIAYGVLRFLVSLFEEGQRLIYLQVKQAAYHEVAVATFEHLHRLSLQWHITKRSGVVLRAMDRGISSAATVVDNLFLRLVPSVLEMIALVIIFFTRYHSPGASFTIIASFVAYFSVTIYIARIRARQRASMNRADNEANQIAVDTIGAFETVKAFNNERFEAGRYSSAVTRFQKATREQQSAYIALNLSQSAIIRASIVGVLLSAASEVVAGRNTVGGFVAMLAFLQQLFQPLSWLGAMYSMLVNAFADMRNLADLMQEEPEVKDAPGAAPLTLTDKAAGATITFEHVAFAYPLAEADRIEAGMDATRAAEDAAAAKKALRRWRWRRVAEVMTMGKVRAGPRPRPAAASPTSPSPAATLTPAAAAASSSGAAGSIELTASPASAAAAGPGGGAGRAGRPGVTDKRSLLGDTDGSSVAANAMLTLTPAATDGSTGSSSSSTAAANDVAITVRSAKAAASSSAGAMSTNSAASAASAASSASTGEGSGDKAREPALRPGVGRTVLHDVSFSVPAGTTTAIVGSTGSGKSTISKLLFRFYDVFGGSIKIDGQDLREVTQDSLRSLVGLVPQDCSLFNDTLR